MESKENVYKKEEGLATEMLGGLKEQLKRSHTIILVQILAIVAIIAGFLLYMNQYDFESTVEQNGVYTLIDSEGNVISSDINPEQIERIMEIINDGKNQNDKKQN